MRINYKANPIEGWKHVIAWTKNSKGKAFFNLVDNNSGEAIFPWIFHNGVKKSDRHILSLLYKTVVYDLSIDKNGKPGWSPRGY